MPARANEPASRARCSTLEPWGFNAVQVSGRALGADELADALDAEARPRERALVALGKRDVDELHLGLQRAVAEQHVEELRGLGPGGRGRQAEHDLEGIAGGPDRLDARDHVVQHAPVGDRRERHLDALLDGERLRARLDPGSGCGDAVGGEDPLGARCS